MSIDHRAIRIIKKAIANLNLDLHSYSVLTEVGSSNYKYSPIIPLLAGAKEVYAWTFDSSHGKSEDIIKECYEIAKYLDLDNRIQFSANKKEIEHIKQAEIITNSGFIRPINEDLLKYSKSNVVIPLMYEAWEIRKQDIDIEYCKEKNIKVAGTWENHPKIKVFSGIGPLAIKLSLEAGYEVYQNEIIIWSDDYFGDEAEKAFKKFGASKVVKTNDINKLKEVFSSIDFIFVSDYDEKRPYFGEQGVFIIDELININPNFGLVHLYGEIDQKPLKKYNLKIYPDEKGKAMHMTRTLGHLGITPIVNLQTAGLKVGQLMLENNESKLMQPITFEK